MLKNSLAKISAQHAKGKGKKGKKGEGKKGKKGKGKKGKKEKPLPGAKVRRSEERSDELGIRQLRFQ